jgi:hypothetical protein
MIKERFTIMWKLGVYAVVPLALIALPTSFFESAASLCLFKNLFGVEGPGCGITRAVSAVLHGDLWGALEFNKSVVVVFPLLCYVWGGAVRDELKRFVLKNTAAVNEARPFN